MSFQNILFANNAATQLAAPITDSQTTITLTAGTGALFPSPSGSQYFMVTVVDAGTGLLREIMKCTSRATDTLTVVRAQEGTTAKAYNLYDPVANLWTAGQAQEIIQAFALSDLNGGISAIQPYAGNPNTHVAGNAATGAVPPSMVWDTVSLILWACTTTGSAGSAVWVGVGQSDGTIFCGTSTGSANAQVLTPTPALPAYATSPAISFIAGFTNTNATTINVSGLGVKNVYKDGPGGPIPLTGGEIVAGNILTMRYDGTRFQLTATELGTASLANASSNTGTVSAMSGASVVGHLAVFSDVAGTLVDGGALPSQGGAVINTSQSLIPGRYYVDTSAGAITLTVIATLTGAYTFIDAQSTWGVNHLTVNGNGHNIGNISTNVAATFLADVSDYQFSMEALSTYWRLV